MKKIGSDFRLKYGAIMGIICIIGMFAITEYFQTRGMRKNAKLVEVDITKIDECAKVGHCVDFTYVYNGRTYLGDGTTHAVNLKILLDETRPIYAIIDSLQPEDCRLLLLEADYESMDIIPPDSAIWIFDVVRL